MAYVKQSDASFDEFARLIWKFMEDRDWLNNTPRSYATSIAVEAGELLEHYQWSEKAIGDKEALANELADIIIYCFQFALHTDIDIPAAMKAKLAKSAKKYPAEASKGKTQAEREALWLAAHQNHRANKKGL